MPSILMLANSFFVEEEGEGGRFIRKKGLINRYSISDQKSMQL